MASGCHVERHVDKTVVAYPIGVAFQQVGQVRHKLSTTRDQNGFFTVLTGGAGSASGND